MQLEVPQWVLRKAVALKIMVRQLMDLAQLNLRHWAGFGRRNCLEWGGQQRGFVDPEGISIANRSSNVV